MTWLWRELLNVTGSSDVSGRWYGFWSGFAGDIPLFGVFLVLWRRHNCHVRGCWRLQWRTSGEHALCRRHHPSEPPSAADVAL